MSGNGAPRRRRASAKVEEAVDRAAERTQQAMAMNEAMTGDKVLAQMPVLKDAIKSEENNAFTLKVKPAEVPHLLVWVPEQGAYQPVFLPIGTTWRLAVATDDAPPARRLWLPGQQT